MNDNDDLKTAVEQDVTENGAEELDMYVKFSKPYNFEDEVFEGLDLSGLSNLKASDLNDIEKKYYKTGVASFTPENTTTYAMIVAQKVTGLPVEFFQQLPIKYMYKIKNRVVNFFYN